MCVLTSDPPGTPDYVDVTSESVKLKWEAPKRDGGSKIVAYNVEKRQGKGRWLKSNFSNVTDTEFTVTGLACGERYEFRVIARNAIGTVSPPSQSSGYVVIRDESCKFMQFILCFSLSGCHNTCNCCAVYIKKCKIFYLSVAPNIEFGPEYFEGVSIKAGENIRLKVTITGRPTPKVTWFRDNIEFTKKMVDITTISGSSILFIRDADRSHRGLYTVEAINSSGTKKESMKVEVFGMNNFCTLSILFIDFI